MHLLMSSVVVDRKQDELWLVGTSVEEGRGGCVKNMLDMES